MIRGYQGTLEDTELFREGGCWRIPSCFLREGQVGAQRVPGDAGGYRAVS